MSGPLFAQHACINIVTFLFFIELNGLRLFFDNEWEKKYLFLSTVSEI